MQSRHLLIIVAIFFTSISGCGPSVKDDLKWVGVMYHSYHDQFRKGPANWDKLIDFAEKNSARNTHPDSLRRVRDAGYTLKWEVEFQTLQGTKEGMTETVLAESPNSKRGPKLMMDGSVRYPK